MVNIRPYFYAGKDLTFHAWLVVKKKNAVIRDSQALIFPCFNPWSFWSSNDWKPVWGCPVIGSHHGSVTWTHHSQVGLSTSSKNEMVEALKNIDQFSRKACHEYARDQFNHLVMSKEYLSYYEQVLNGYPLHWSSTILFRKFRCRL